MKTLVVYYSNAGSNKYLAEKIANTLGSDSEAIKPRVNVFPLLLIFSLAKGGMGIRKLKHNVTDYDRVIVCSPIWMGTIISPLRSFFNKHGRNIDKLYFATCCGSSDAARNEKFGHALVFNDIKNLLGGRCVHCEAFPITMVLPYDKRKDGSAVMKTRLSDANFNGEIKARFDTFMQKVEE